MQNQLLLAELNWKLPYSLSLPELNQNKESSGEVGSNSSLPCIGNKQNTKQFSFSSIELNHIKGVIRIGCFLFLYQLMPWYKTCLTGMRYQFSISWFYQVTNHICWFPFLFLPLSQQHFQKQSHENTTANVCYLEILFL